VLEKCGTADCTPAAVTIEERIGWIPLWEMALDYGERCVRKIQWPLASKASITITTITSITTVPALLLLVWWFIIAGQAWVSSTLTNLPLHKAHYYYYQYTCTLYYIIITALHICDCLHGSYCHRCFGEDCTYPHVTITEDLLNSMDANLQSVVFYNLSCFVVRSPFGVIWLNLNLIF